ncbi:hypothetical protein TPY_2699 [Sulfobacillus acidophilus TPY]|uniref:Diguanylate cyclase n=1 Tax=Sulfobacillus acidophilus (strain ATCC 700253 / DSM 10332 / NAL) TaxID=679936 RepID=G8TUN3_SULAD|nr:hypothetical protein TPY_2699 [Sulfobacillus acidophilus TPY]AEW04680.1 diguanylate cyclase [Sulfobacillus acidophilus DSM 10332]
MISWRRRSVYWTEQRLRRTQWTFWGILAVVLVGISGWLVQMTSMMWTWPAQIPAQATAALQTTLVRWFEGGGIAAWERHGIPAWTPLSFNARRVVIPAISLQSAMASTMPNMSSLSNLSGMSSPPLVTSKNGMTGRAISSSVMPTMSSRTPPPLSHRPMPAPSPIEWQAVPPVPPIFQGWWTGSWPQNHGSVTAWLRRAWTTHRPQTWVTGRQVGIAWPIRVHGRWQVYLAQTSLRPWVVAANANNRFLFWYTAGEFATVAVILAFLYWGIERWVIRPIRWQAQRDLMTSLYNQITFWELAEQLAARAAATHTPLSVLALDMDRFKSVNDTYGHQVGDLALKTLAEAILTNIRESDLPGRIGGEEFAVVLPQTAWRDAKIVAERIRVTLENTPVDPITHPLTVSIGVSALGEGEDVRSLMKRADQALYQAKDQGRNRVVVISPPAVSEMA